MKRRNIKSPQQKFHVKKNDEVVVLAGVERGKRGKVLQVLRQVNRVLVEGVNIHKKTARKSQDNPQGGFIEREAPMHVSNVMLASVYDGGTANAEKKNKKK